MSTPTGGFSRASTSAASASATPKRPASIQELAQRAEFVWEPSKDFKFWLKVAEKSRHAGQDYDLYGDLENAFVEYAKAATLILDKIPTHRDYHTRLDPTQRETLIMKGKGVLDRMGQIKPPLIDRHNAWEDALARGEVPARTPISQKPYENEHRQRDTAPLRRPSTNGRPRDGRQIWHPDAAIVAQEKRRQEESQSQAQAAQAAKARVEQRTRAEQAGIVQRQREAEEEARAVRRAAAAYNVPSGSQPSFVSIPVPNPVTPRQSALQSSTRSIYDIPLDPPPLLPLESPTRRYDGDSTDAETEESNDDQLYKKIADLSMDSHHSSSAAVTSPFGGYVSYFVLGK
ncbi:hypothetical protein DFH11DRAFT_1511304 [Phellopilus nigrolimitatus]|nr:hypothetical protein DFH11DRAFT_1511304 [Phellopilus nigrolimitatus]